MRDDIRKDEAVTAQHNPDTVDTASAEAGAEQVADGALRQASNVDSQPSAAEPPHGEPFDVEPLDVDAVEVEPARDGEARDEAGRDGLAAGAGVREVAIAPVAVPETPLVMWDESSVSELRTRWDAIQMRFVDDPGTTAAGARALVSEAIEALKASLARHEQELAAGDPASEDTEELRQLVSRYRAIFESVVRP